MEMKMEVKISTLSAHPLNDYFFDDMSGTKWDEFMESVKTSGVIEPIVITKTNIIVSGHQRVRACKKLNIDNIPARVKDYANEDEVIKDLLETNIRQRGNIDSSGTKLGRVIKELERLYEVKNGGDRKSVSPMEKLIPNNVKSQQDLIEMLDTNKDTYHRAKRIADLIPELQEMEIDGNISMSVAARILSKLSIDDQVKLFEALPKDVKLSEKDVREHIKFISEDIEDMEKKLNERKEELERKDKELVDVRLAANQWKTELARKDRDAAGIYIKQRDESTAKLRKEQEACLEYKGKLTKTAEQLTKLTQDKEALESKIAELERVTSTCAPNDMLRFLDLTNEILKIYAHNNTLRDIAKTSQQFRDEFNTKLENLRESMQNMTAEYTAEAI